VDKQILHTLNKLNSTPGFVTIEYIIIGEGNLKFVPSPLLRQTEDWDVSEPVLKDSHYVQANKLISVRTIKYTMNSNVEGQNIIPEFEQLYFNNKTMDYASLISERHSVVTHKVEVYIDPLNDLNDIVRPLHLLSEQGGKMYKIGLVIASGFLVLLGGFLVKSIREKKANKRNFLYAGTKAFQSLTMARAQVESQDLHSFYETIYNVMWSYIRDKFKVQAQDQNIDSVERLFSGLGISNNVINSFIRLNDSCQLRVYAKQDSQEIDLGLIDDVENLILNLEKQMNETEHT